ncbi:MAG: zinc ABC transporter ATP-binding protein ZnuC [bacterium]|nr:zinc ABC transporter ATP-binding protein ZnuC [bacterium]
MTENSSEVRKFDSAKELVGAEHVGVRAGDRWLVRHVDLQVRQGEIVTLIGPNGSGKSTTAKIVLGLLDPNEGHVRKSKNLRIGYVPQSLAIDLNLPLTVKRLMTLTADHDLQEIKVALHSVGASHTLNCAVQELSGGEFQRVLLARAIISKPQLLVLDEPVQGVDYSGEIALYELVGALRDQLHCGILLISHDLHIVMAATDTVVCLNGHVCCQGSPQRVANDPEYHRLFGVRAADTLALYHHDHDHHHHADGSIIAQGETCECPLDAASDAQKTDERDAGNV